MTLTAPQIESARPRSAAADDAATTTTVAPVPSGADALAWCRTSLAAAWPPLRFTDTLLPEAVRPIAVPVACFLQWMWGYADESDAAAYYAQWRRDVDAAIDGAAAHPVLAALRPALTSGAVDAAALRDTVSGTARWAACTEPSTWNELVEAVEGAVRPGSDLLLRVIDAPDTPQLRKAATCAWTAYTIAEMLRTLASAGPAGRRLPLPRDLVPDDAFFEHLRAYAAAGVAGDTEFLPASRKLVKDLAKRTFAILEQAEPLHMDVPRALRAWGWSLECGAGQALRAVRDWNYETALHDPGTSRFAATRLLWSSRLAGSRFVKMRARPT